MLFFSIYLNRGKNNNNRDENLFELNDLNPLASLDVKDIDATVTEAKQERLVVGHVQWLAWPHDLLHSTATAVYIYIHTECFFFKMKRFVLL